MRRVLSATVFFVISLIGFAQNRIQMKYESGVYTIPCEVNGLKLRFIFDTGASDVSLSLMEAGFMLKNGYLDTEDFLGTKNYENANGELLENTIVNLKKIKIGSKVITDVKACIVNNLKAPILLGQSAISKLGPYEINNGFLILKEEKTNVPSARSYREYYDGSYKNGLRHGYGTYHYTSGAIYEGQWKNDKREGKGVYRDTTGYSYEGKWKNNTYEGKGKQIWNDGDCYVGMFVNGKREGKGIYTFSNGDKYEGLWRNGNRNGKGTIYYANGSKYVGEWQSSKRNGFGVLESSNGYRYKGEWKDDEYSGKGIQNWVSPSRYAGDSFEGKFSNGLKDGYGVYKWANGDIYKGNWKNGNRSGFGTLTDKNGYIYSGEWENDDYEGIGHQSWKNGDKYDGNFVNGKREGKGIYYYANGDKYDGEWKEGKKEGQGVFYYANGGGKTGYWKNNEYVGKYYSDYNPSNTTSIITNNSNNSTRNTITNNNSTIFQPLKDIINDYFKTSNNVLTSVCEYLYENYDIYDLDPNNITDYDSFVNSFKKESTRRYWYNILKADNYALPDYDTFDLRMNAQRYAPSRLKSSYYSKKDNAEKNNKKDEKTHGLSGGYYLATTTTTLNLRECASTDCDVICKIPQGKQVLFSADTQKDGFILVLYIDESEFGYVSYKYLKNFTELEVDENGSLQVVGSSTNKSYAEITIKNDTELKIAVSIGKKNYTFKPQEKKTVTVAPGTYVNTASAPGIKPYLGKDKVEAGHAYEWTFYIISRSIR